MISREDVAAAIAEAERVIADYVGYSLLPSWVADERVPVTRPGILPLSYGGLSGYNGYGGYGYSGGYGDYAGGRDASVQLRRGYYLSGGVEAWTLIDGAATVTYSDPDNDGFDELATITAATTVTDPAEIALVFPGIAAPACAVWEVRPLRSVTITAGVVTVTCWRWQLPLPELWEAFQPTAIDGDDDANFLEEVAVWRHFNDPQTQAQFLWSPSGCGGCGSCAACTIGAQNGCLVGRDYRLGIVIPQPATWDATAGAFTGAGWAGWRTPDSLRLWYRAGLKNDSLQYPTLMMDPTWERAVAYYAITLLDRELCGCSNLSALALHWRTDLALNESSPTGSGSFQIGNRVTDNPFGTTRGALNAFNRANADGNTIGRGVAL